MVFLGVKNADHSLNFFRLLTLLTELSGGPAGNQTLNFIIQPLFCLLVRSAVLHDPDHV